MTIFFYLSRTYLKTFLLVVSFILGLILIVDGIDQYGLIKNNNTTLAQCLLYVVIRVPANLYQFLPLAILISALMFFMNLAKHSELVALRASGISASRIVLVPVIVTAIIGLILIGPFNNLLVSSKNITDNYADSLRGRSSAAVRRVETGVWLREAIGSDVRFIYIPSINWKTKSFSDVEFFIKSGGLNITHIISKKARIVSDEWVLNDNSTFGEEEPTQRKNLKTISLKTQYNFDNIFASFLDPTRVTLRKLPAFISKLERDGYETNSAKTYFMSELSTPVFLVLMVLIGSVFALAPLRKGGAGVRSITAISTGFIFFGMTKLTESMSKAGDLPVELGVFVVPIAGILLAMSLLLHQEDG